MEKTTGEIILEIMALKRNEDVEGFTKLFKSLNDNQLNGVLKLSKALGSACEGQLIINKIGRNKP